VFADPKLKAKAEKYVFDHVENGDFKARTDRVFPFSQIVEAHRYMESNGQIGKIVVSVLVIFGDDVSMSLVELLLDPDVGRRSQTRHEEQKYAVNEGVVTDRIVAAAREYLSRHIP